MAINNSLADCSYLVTLHCNEILKSTIYKGVFYISDFRMHFLHCVAIFITYLIEQNQGKLWKIAMQCDKRMRKPDV